MFHRFLELMQMRRSTAFLLSRGDDRLLEDIGLSRSDLETMHLGIAQHQDTRWLESLHSQARSRRLPVPV